MYFPPSLIIQGDLDKNAKSIISKGNEPNSHYSGLLTVTVDSSKNVVLTGGKDRMIKVWDVREAKAVGTLKGHRDTVTGLKCQRSGGGNLVSVSEDKSLKMWDIGERAYLDTL